MMNGMMSVIVNVMMDIMDIYDISLYMVVTVRLYIYIYVYIYIETVESTNH